MTPPRPGIDPELRALLDGLPSVPALTPEFVAELRLLPTPPIEPFLQDRAITHTEVAVPAPDGTPIPLSIFSPADPRTPAPCVYWIHGGGMIMGNRFANIDLPLEWADRFGAVVVSVDYRLAPEATGTTLVEDCYHGLLWTTGHATALGIDPTRVVIAGISAGGGLAAGTALLSRDRGTPPLAAQLLICPMLDHRNTTTSSHQYSGTETPGTRPPVTENPGDRTSGTRHPATENPDGQTSGTPDRGDQNLWTREMNEFGWHAVLGEDPGPYVPVYVSPALADDLSGLPPTYIDAGTAELFRDEDVDYATRIWAAGGQADLHIWSGGFHAFDALFPQAALSTAARRTRNDWLSRVLTPSGPLPPPPQSPSSRDDRR
ncbi:alpha/beta hydrolase [Sphaerisporangium rubeum]|uniref:Acetyl esterase/lipase n=1 Tax=Sphaerisporangium rubeum TaxID=321317 RepID=A0A7X0IET3_9ACTN|nr:alpha/beta hydrolase fold domain-containing protein [Sphaerisporangium rubeum]MBB6472648.1 acetyl esterase/lipase [Sphaerisporangium rubeum]